MGDGCNIEAQQHFNKTFWPSWEVQCKNPGLLNVYIYLHPFQLYFEFAVTKKNHFSDKGTGLYLYWNLYIGYWRSHHLKELVLSAVHGIFTLKIYVVVSCLFLAVFCLNKNKNNYLHTIYNIITQTKIYIFSLYSSTNILKLVHE